MTLPTRLSAARYVSLETSRRSGATVRTPVWFVELRDELCIRTDPRSGKAKRMRNNPSVRVAPCTVRGEPTGDWFEGRARFLGVEDSAATLRLFRKRYGLQYAIVGLWRRLRGAPPFAVIAVTLADAN